MTLSKHASERMQQRGISKAALELLQRYGSEYYQKGGTRTLVLSRKDRQKAAKDLKRLLSGLDGKSTLYCVLNEDDTVITAGHRYKSIKKSS